MKKTIYVIDNIAFFIITLIWINHRFNSYNIILRIIATLITTGIIANICDSRKQFRSFLGWMVFDALNILGISYILQLSFAFSPLNISNALATTISLVVGILIVIFLEKHVIHPYGITYDPDTAKGTTDASVRSSIISKLVNDAEMDMVRIKQRIADNPECLEESYISDEFDLLEMNYLKMKAEYVDYLKNEDSKDVGKTYLEDLYSSILESSRYFRKTMEEVEAIIDKYAKYNSETGQNAYQGTDSRKDNRVDSHTTDTPSNDVNYFRGCGDQDSIKARYRALCKVYHPDSGNGDEETFRQITEQYENLTK